MQTRGLVGFVVLALLALSGALTGPRWRPHNLRLRLSEEGGPRNGLLLRMVRSATCRCCISAR